MLVSSPIPPLRSLLCQRPPGDAPSAPCQPRILLLHLLARAARRPPPAAAGRLYDDALAGAHGSGVLAPQADAPLPPLREPAHPRVQPALRRRRRPPARTGGRRAAPTGSTPAPARGTRCRAPRPRRRACWPARRPTPRRSENSRSTTGYRRSNTSASVMRVLVMCVCTPDEPSHVGPLACQRWQEVESKTTHSSAPPLRSSHSTRTPWSRPRPTRCPQSQT